MKHKGIYQPYHIIPMCKPTYNLVQNTSYNNIIT